MCVQYRRRPMCYLERFSNMFLGIRDTKLSNQVAKYRITATKGWNEVVMSRHVLKM